MGWGTHLAAHLLDDASEFLTVRPDTVESGHAWSSNERLVCSRLAVAQAVRRGRCKQGISPQGCYIDRVSFN